MQQTSLLRCISYKEQCRVKLPPCPQFYHLRCTNRLRDLPQHRAPSERKRQELVALSVLPTAISLRELSSLNTQGRTSHLYSKTSQAVSRHVGVLLYLRISLHGPVPHKLDPGRLAGPVQTPIGISHRRRRPIPTSSLITLILKDGATLKAMSQFHLCSSHNLVRKTWPEFGKSSP